MTEPESNKVKHLFVHIMQTYQFTGNATYNTGLISPARLHDTLRLFQTYSARIFKSSSHLQSSREPEQRGFGGTQKAVMSGVNAQCLPNKGCFKLDRS